MILNSGGFESRFGIDAGVEWRLEWGIEVNQAGSGTFLGGSERPEWLSSRHVADRRSGHDMVIMLEPPGDEEAKEYCTSTSGL